MDTTIKQWDYIIHHSNIISHVIDPRSSSQHFGIFCLHTVLEYILQSESTYVDHERNFDGRIFYRFGLGSNLRTLRTSGLGGMIKFSDMLNRDVTTVQSHEIVSVICPKSLLRDVVEGKVAIPSDLLTQLKEVIAILYTELGIELDSLGIMGSIGFGISNNYSDIDLMYYCEDFNKDLIRTFHSIAQSTITAFSKSPYGTRSIYNARKHYLPISEERMIFHEQRKLTGFLGEVQAVPRKISIFPVISPGVTHRDRAERSIPGPIVKIRGNVINSKLGSYLGAEYSVLVKQLCWQSCDSLIDICQIHQIVDRMGNFYLQCEEGEEFECLGLLEEIVTGPFQGQYRVSLDHWHDELYYHPYLYSL